MANLYDTLVGLSPARDDELLDGYRRYEASLASNLSPEQLSAYAEWIQHMGVVRVVEDLTPDEISGLSSDTGAAVATIIADKDISSENRRVVALLNQYGQHNVAPDIDYRGLEPAPDAGHASERTA